MDKGMPTVNSVSAHLDMTAKLPTLPAVAARIIDTLRNEAFSSKDLVDLISIDPALSVKVLNIANSPLYSVQGNVDNVTRAVDVLGTNIVRNLALSFSIIDGITGDSCKAFDHGSFWKRSVIKAVAADSASKLLNRYSNEVFIVGLLADIGKLLMHLVRPDDYMRVLNEIRFTGLKDYEIERSIFSYTHANIGGETLRRWGIPCSIYEPIALHHDKTDKCAQYSEIVEMIRVGSMVADIYFNKSQRETMESLCSLMNDKKGLEAEEVRSFVDGVAANGSEILANFDISSSMLKPYSHLLEEANAELLKLNLTYDQLLQSLCEEKEKAQKLAMELKEANHQLKELIGTDGLTGLYNYRYFQGILHDEMARAQRYSHLVSLVMVDIDNFKNINDTYGHLSGDAALRSVAGLIWETGRNTDTVARYGGEEFAVILPETDMKGAAIFAERVRKKIETNLITVDNMKTRVTVSMGISVYDPNKGKRDKDEFVKAADKALYNSKNSGKNKISIASL